MTEEVDRDRTLKEYLADLEEYACWLLNEYQRTGNLSYLLHGWRWIQILGDSEVSSLVEYALLEHIKRAEGNDPAALPQKHKDRFRIFQRQWKDVEAMVVKIDGGESIEDAAYQVAGRDDTKISHLIDRYYALGRRVTRGRLPAKFKKRR